MKHSLVLLMLAGLLGLTSLPAHAQTEQNFGPEIRYAPEQRFAMPVSKATGLNNAKNVVIKEVSLNAVPEFIRIQAETLAETCTKDIENKKLIKFYRYTSDATRDNAVSASYILDLTGWASKPQQACVLGNACTKDGCYMVGYNSTAYEKWGQHFSFRQKEWEYKNLEDSKLKAILTVFNIMTKCKADPEKKDNKENCWVKRVWLERGFVEYKEGALLDNVSPFVEPTPVEIPQTSEDALPEDVVPVPPSAAPSNVPTDTPSDTPSEPTDDVPPAAQQ